MWFFLMLIFLLIIDILNIATLPLIFLLFFSVLVAEKQAWVFSFAFLSGFLLDILLLRPIGQTSLFFVSFIFIVLLYGRKFEAQTSTFIFSATFLGEILYLWLFKYAYFIQQALISAVVALVLWKIINKFGKSGVK